MHAQYLYIIFFQSWYIFLRHQGRFVRWNSYPPQNWRRARQINLLILEKSRYLLHCRDSLIGPVMTRWRGNNYTCPAPLLVAWLTIPSIDFFKYLSAWNFVNLFTTLKRLTGCGLCSGHYPLELGRQSGRCYSAAYQILIPFPCILSFRNLWLLLLFK